MEEFHNYKWVKNLPSDKVEYLELFVNKLESIWKQGYELNYSEIDHNFREWYDDPKYLPYLTMTFHFSKIKKEGN